MYIRISLRLTTLQASVWFARIAQRVCRESYHCNIGSIKPGHVRRVQDCELLYHEDIVAQVGPGGNSGDVFKPLGAERPVGAWSYR
jgi:hypothetical protein